MLHPVLKGSLAVAGFSGHGRLGGGHGQLGLGIGPAVGHHHPPKSHYAGNGKPKLIDSFGFLGDPQAVVNPSAVESDLVAKRDPHQQRHKSRKKEGGRQAQDRHPPPCALYRPNSRLSMRSRPPFTVRPPSRRRRIAPSPSATARPRCRCLGRRPSVAVAYTERLAGPLRRRRQGRARRAGGDSLWNVRAGPVGALPRNSLGRSRPLSARGKAARHDALFSLHIDWNQG